MYKSFPTGCAINGFTGKFYTVCVSMCGYAVYMCCAHSMHLCCAWTGAHVMRCECVWLVSKWESGYIWRFYPPHFFSLPFTLCRSFSWFDLRQRTQFLNSTPWVLLIRAPTRCSRAPERDTACTQNGRKSNSSRQWGPFVQLSRMKDPYLASQCFSHHLPVSHCRPEKIKAYLRERKVVKNCFGPNN